MRKQSFLLPVSAVEVIESVPCFTKFHIGIDLDKISDEFIGQGHRSKIKVTRLKVWFPSFFLIGVNISKVLAYGMYSVMSWRHATSQHDIMMSCDVRGWRHDVIMSGNITESCQLGKLLSVTWENILAYDVTSCEVTEWRHDVTEVTEWRQITTVWQKRLWHIRGRCVNARAFSYS